MVGYGWWRWILTPQSLGNPPCSSYTCSSLCCFKLLASLDDVFSRAISHCKRLIHLPPSHPSSEISVKVSVAILAKFPGISPKFPSRPGSRKSFKALWIVAKPDVRNSHAGKAAYQAIDEGFHVPTIKGADGIPPMSKQVDQLPEAQPRPPRRTTVRKVKTLGITPRRATSARLRSKAVRTTSLSTLATIPESGLRSEETVTKASSAPVLPRWCPFQ